MDVAIAGGHGKIALALTRLLDERGDRVRSLIRNAEQSGDVEEAGAEAVLCDLEADDAERIAGAIAGADAVIFAAGAGPDSGDERKETMDYGGAVKLIEAAERAEVSRYLMISSMGADAEQEGDGGFAIYLRAKGRADEALRESDLEHTIVRPGGLTDDEATGKVFASSDGERGQIPRADVAAVLAAALADPAAAGKTFEVISGETPIAEAVAAL